MKTNYFYHVTIAVKKFWDCGTRKCHKKPSKSVIACCFIKTEKTTTIYQKFKKCFSQSVFALGSFCWSNSEELITCSIVSAGP